MKPARATKTDYIQRKIRIREDISLDTMYTRRPNVFRGKIKLLAQNSLPSGKYLSEMKEIKFLKQKWGGRNVLPADLFCEKH